MDVAHGSAHHVSPEIQTMFKEVEILTIVSWSMYPPTVLLGRAHFGIVSDAFEDALICVLDCISKIAFEGLLIYNIMKIYGNGNGHDDGQGGGHRYF
jgi:bacteriorhodopsin